MLGRELLVRLIQLLRRHVRGDVPRKALVEFGSEAMDHIGVLRRQIVPLARVVQYVVQARGGEVAHRTAVNQRVGAARLRRILLALGQACVVGLDGLLIRLVVL